MSNKGILNDRKLKKLTAKLGKDMKRVVKVGILQSAGAGESHDSHPATSPGEGAEISMVELAAIHEFGSPTQGIPARSFLAATFKQSGVRQEQGVLSRKIATAILEDKINVDQGLGLLGVWAEARVKKRIKAGISPRNAEYTVKKKKSSKPLVDTGRMINAVTHKVEPESE